MITRSRRSHGRTARRGVCHETARTDLLVTRPAHRLADGACRRGDRRRPRRASAAGRSQRPALAHLARRELGQTGAARLRCGRRIRATVHLGPAPPYLRRFDPDAGAFTALPATGGLGSGARDLANPVAVAAAGRSLFVADRGNRRVAVFDTPTLSLRALWEPRDGAGRPVPPDHPDVWDPVSVARRSCRRPRARRRAWRCVPRS